MVWKILGERVIFDPPVTSETKNRPYTIGLIVTRTKEVLFTDNQFSITLLSGKLFVA